MQAKQNGFTLIELVVVIVILGILAATALPKFINLTQEADAAATKGVAAAATSGFAINYGGHKLNAAKGVAISAADPCTAAIVGSVMQGGVLPAGYTMAAIAGTQSCVATANDGLTGTCTLNGGSGTTAAITYLCANP